MQAKIRYPKASSAKHKTLGIICQYSEQADFTWFAYSETTARIWRPLMISLVPGPHVTLSDPEIPTLPIKWYHLHMPSPEMPTEIHFSLSSW